MSVAVPATDWVTYHETGMTFLPETPYAVWEECVGTLQRIAGSVQWWIGDALRFGERTYGETYAQAIESTGQSYGHLANCKWVAGRYDPSLRNEDVTWNHHVALADMDDVDERQDLLREAGAEGWSVSRLKDERQARVLAREMAAPAPDAQPDPPYRVILADPPWQYDQRSVRLNGTTDRHYATMPTEAIAALPVADIAADDAILLLWTTWPFLLDAQRVIDGWGFRYVTGVPWVKADEIGTDFEGTVRFKPNKGVGYWFRGCTEPLLMAKRGTPKRLRMPLDGILSDRNIHSRKPTCVHELAETFGAPCLEVFARERRPGWALLGNALDGRDVGEAMRALVG